MNERCEAFETAVSAWLDGELAPAEQLPAVDHLLACPSCRSFYHRARKLGEMVAQSEAADLGPAPEEVWHRIAGASGLAGRPPAVRVPRWALRIAAVAVLGLGLGLGQHFLWRPAAPGDAAVPATAGDGGGGEVFVELEGERGTMSEERFLELTTELLQADRGYHRKMLRIMDLVTAATEPEGSVDEDRERGEGQRISVGDERESGEGSFVFAGDRL